MSAKIAIFMTVLCGGLVLIGAGCPGRSPAISDKSMGNGYPPPGEISKLTVPGAQQPAGTAPVEPAASSAETSVSGPAAPQPAAVPASQPASERWPRPTTFPGILPAEELADKQAVITTDKGIIVFRILGDEGPRAASNFIALARSGFYDGLTFHRVVPGFVVQGGDPRGDGTGGPGYQFEDDPVSSKAGYHPGIVAMANAGPDTNGSQFFIVTDEQPSLPKLYSIFGLVTRGLDVVRRISVGDVMNSVVIEDVK